MASCACTIGSIDDADKTIPPGEERSVTVIIDPHRIPLFHSKKTLTIYSNDRNNLDFPVTIECRIDPEIELSQEIVEFGVLEKGTSPKLTLRMRQMQEVPLCLEGVEESRKKGGGPDTGLLVCDFRELPESQWERPGKVEYEDGYFEQLIISSRMKARGKLRYPGGKDIDLGGESFGLFAADVHRRVNLFSQVPKPGAQHRFIAPGLRVQPR